MPHHKELVFLFLLIYFIMKLVFNVNAAIFLFFLFFFFFFLAFARVYT